MSYGNSKTVTSSQKGIHHRLRDRWEAHCSQEFKRPISNNGLKAWETLVPWLSEGEQTPVILDAGCGTGESTHILKSIYPDDKILGLDKSAHRLAKNNDSGRTGVLTLRMDLQDFFQLASRTGLTLKKIYFLYPNPWPKPEHLVRRWYAHPLLPQILSLTGMLEVRTNWPLYAQEFAQVLGWSRWETELTVADTTSPVSPFERKYRDSGQELLVLRANNPESKP